MSRVEFVMGRMALKRFVEREEPQHEIAAFIEAAELVGREQLGAVVPPWLYSDDALRSVEPEPRPIYCNDFPVPSDIEPPERS